MFEPDADLTPEPCPAPLPVPVLERIRVAFQGELGAFSEDAVLQIWGDAAEPVPMRTFEDVMQAAEDAEVDFGLLPIESTLVGGLDSAYDLLAYHERLRIAAEAVVPIQLCLLGHEGATVADLRTLESHPVMLAQCAHFLARYRHIAPRPAWDTAGAAREVMEAGDGTRAAAGSRRAAQRFGLAVLAERIEDRPDTQMRFLAVSPEPAAIEAGTPARTALLATLRDDVGALVAALEPFARAGLNVSHLTTRPTREPWRYQFFIEFEHEAGSARALQALEGARRASAACRVLGTYPRCPRALAQTGGFGGAGLA